MDATFSVQEWQAKGKGTVWNRKRPVLLLHSWFDQRCCFSSLGSVVIGSEHDGFGREMGRNKPNGWKVRIVANSLGPIGFVEVNLK